MPHEYKCAICEGVFVSSKTVEEELADARKRFGEGGPDDFSAVCDNCAKKIEAWLAEKN